jgi:transposase-like protein
LERRARVDLRVVGSLSRSQLPLLRGLDGATVAEIHDGEEAFEDWRRALRRAVRRIESSESTGLAFESESREILDDELTPMAEEVARAVGRSALLRERSRDAKITLTSGVAVAGAASVAGVASPAALGTAAGSAFASWLLGALFPKGQQGARAIVAHLMNAEGSPDALPRPDEAVVLAPKPPFA